MSKKIMKLPSLFKNKETTKQPWQWPLCKEPETLSFRARDDMFKTVNSMFFDPNIDGVETPESWFTTSSESVSFSTESEDLENGESLEMLVRGVRSERLFFEPDDTSSILAKAKWVLAMESEDPYIDFRRSMEEMVETHGLKDWECLEELLGWYLKMNGKKNHGFIVGAFVDLLVGLSSTSCSDSTSYSSAVSSFSSSPLCSSEGQNEIEEIEVQQMVNQEAFNLGTSQRLSHFIATPRMEQKHTAMAGLVKRQISILDGQIPPRHYLLFLAYLGDFLICLASPTQFGYMGLNWAKLISSRTNGTRTYDLLPDCTNCWSSISNVERLFCGQRLFLSRLVCITFCAAYVFLFLFLFLGMLFLQDLPRFL
ncbi:transcription repressor ofp13 [Quercus suber]|uniref:Transcription repressor n=1 Tax=Quercus suber TaxID=58331 RepID=A0AAW0KC15_QUESU